MRIWLALMFTLAPLCGSGGDSTSVSAPTKKVYVLPVRDDIMPPLVYLVPSIRLLPVPAMDWLARFLGVNSSMNEFTGRG